MSGGHEEKSTWRKKIILATIGGTVAGLVRALVAEVVKHLL
jgi:fluoride ion exporter CrcB/FEX